MTISSHRSRLTPKHSGNSPAGVPSLSNCYPPRMQLLPADRHLD